MKTIEATIPTSWNEMKKFHLLMYCKLLSLHLAAEDLLYALVFRFLKTSMRNYQKVKTHQYEFITKKLEFLFSEECTLTSFPVNSFRYRFVNYYSPGDNLKFSTVEEIAEADSYFNAYMKLVAPAEKKQEASAEDPFADLREQPEQPAPSAPKEETRAQQEEYLCKMVAALYRPASIGGWIRKIFLGKDIRCKYNSYTVTRRAKRFKKLPAYIKHAVLFQFIGCRTMNVKNNPELYNAAGENVFGWAGTIISLAGPEIGTIDDVAKMLWNNALVFMKKVEHDRQKIQHEFEQRKRASEKSETPAQ